jgi:hypothetical protein
MQHSHASSSQSQVAEHTAQRRTCWPRASLRLLFHRQASDT